jgi:hypothetical protein
MGFSLRFAGLDVPCAYVEDGKLDDGCRWIRDWVYLMSGRNTVAVVFDIDHTLLVGKEPIAEVVSLFLDLQRMRNVLLFIITARMETASYRERTISDLLDAGVQIDSDRLFMLPPDIYELGDEHEIAKFKESKRLYVTANFANVVASVGDSLTDHIRSRRMRGELSDLSDRDCVFFQARESMACLKLKRN